MPVEDGKPDFDALARHCELCRRARRALDEPRERWQRELLVLVLLTHRLDYAALTAYYERVVRSFTRE